MFYKQRLTPSLMRKTGGLADRVSARKGIEYRHVKVSGIGMKRYLKNKNRMEILSLKPVVEAATTLTLWWRWLRLFAQLPATRARSESVHWFVLTRCSGLRGCRGLLYSSVADNHTLLRMEKWRLIDFTAIPMERQWMCHQFNPLFNGSNLARKCSLN